MSRASGGFNAFQGNSIPDFTSDFMITMSAEVSVIDGRIWKQTMMRKRLK